MQKKRIISIILVILLAMTSMPSFALAEGEGITMGYYDENGDWQPGTLTQTLPEGVSSVNKTAVKDPNNPNKFNVTLEVVTAQTATTTPPSSAATVLVIDTSGSMQGKRIASAKAAAIDFVNTYSGDTPGTGRYLAVVNFNTRVSNPPTLSWIDVSTTSGKNAAINAINGLNAVNNTGTNLHAGLKMANVLLGDNIVSTIPKEAKNVVALTDGRPTYGLELFEPIYIMGTQINRPDITIGGVGYDIFGAGNAGSSDINNATAAEATTLKAAANVFTICYGAANETTYNGGPKVGAFLANNIASSTANAYNADDSDDLSAVFTAISETIISGLDGSGMTVVDSPVEFVTVGNLPEGIELGSDGFTWALNNPEIETVGNTTYYRYTLTYTVTLDADNTSFEEGEWYPLNGNTELNIPNEDGTTTTVKFPIPAGQGTKTDYSVTYEPGDHGTFAKDTTGELHIGDNTPQAPETTGENGWKFVGWDTEPSPTVTGNATYTAQWEKDYTVEKELRYTVEHWVDGETAARDTETISETVWVNEPDTLTIQDITLKNYTGYKYGSNDAGLTEGTGVLVGAGTIADKGVIKVTYVKDDDQKKELSYTVEHWVEGETAARDTETVKETVWVNEPDTLTIQDITLKNYTGYKYGSNDAGLTEGTGVLVGAGTIADKGVIKVTYVKDEDQKKELSYTVEHWVEGETAARDTETVKETVWVNAADKLTVQDITLKTYTGYKYDSNDAGLTVGAVTLIGSGTIADKGVIKVTYVKDDDQKKELSYTIEHWVDGETAARDTETISETVWVNEPDTLTIQDITLKNYTGYKYGSNDAGLTEGTGVLVGAGTIADKGVIKVTYVKDDDQKKELSYTVEHWVEGETAARDTETVKEEVWVNAADTLTVKDITLNDYTGYKYGSNDAGLTEGTGVLVGAGTIADKGVIKVTYVKDDDQKKELSYTVEHWVEGETAARDTETVKEEVWVNAADTLTVKDITLNDYTGYKYGSNDAGLTEGTGVLVGAGTIADKGVIKVTYVKDDDQKKELRYTVEHWVDGETASRDTETVKEEVWVNAADTLTVKDITLNDYTGYKYDSNDAGLTEGTGVLVGAGTIADKGVIKVTYVKDEDQKKELSYTVEHWVEGETAARDTETVKEEVWVNAADKLTVQDITLNDYIGYKYDSNDAGLTEGTGILVGAGTIADKGVIKVTYVKDDDQKKELSYTIEHWVEGEIAARDTETVKEKVWVNAADTLTVKDITLNDYTGYKYDSNDAGLTEGTGVLVGVGTIADKGVIKVTYVKDEDQKKELSYTVEHWVEGETAARDTETVKEEVWVNAADTLTVKDITLNDYTGYKYDSNDAGLTEGTGILVGSGTIADKGVIKVTYVRDDDQKKELRYTVEHWVEGETAARDTETVKEEVWVNAADTLTVKDITLNDYTGYKYDSNDAGLTEGIGILVGAGTIADKGIIKVTYVKDEDQKKELSYTVEHWVEGEIAARDTETVKEEVWVNAADKLTVQDITLNDYIGYKYDSNDAGLTEGTGVLVGAGTIADKGVIKVAYVKDDDQKKELSYTVEYYKDEAKVGEDTFTETVWVNDTKMPVNFTVDENKYIGYKFDRVEYDENDAQGEIEISGAIHRNPAVKLANFRTEINKTALADNSAVLPETISQGGVIRVYYVKDESQTYDLSYTVEFYKDGVKTEEETFTETVWVNDTEIPVNFTVDENKYVGYKFDSTNPEIIPETIADGGVIKVYYVRDDSQTKELTYTVEHWVEGETAARDTETITEKVWVNEPDRLAVQDILLKEYAGTKYASNDAELTEAEGKLVGEGTILNKGIIKVNYAKEKYTVTYTDGMEGKAFADQVFETLEYGVTTPEFDGTPELKWYKFTGWKPEVAETVTGNAIYVAQWEEVGKEESIDIPPKPEPPKTEPKKPETVVPFTGDKADEAMWLMLLLASVISASQVFFERKKEEQ